jgi:hemerythrin-like domain-containing protein
MTIQKVGLAATYDESSSGGNGAKSSKKTKAEGAKTSSDGGSSNGALFGAAAAGLAVGLAANLGRKAVVQGVTAASGDWDQALATEHAMTLKVFDALEATTDKQKAKRSTLLMTLKHALTKHAVQEENVIYPALRDAGKTEAADHLNHDHGYVKDYLYHLENMPKDSPEFLTTLARFRTDIEKHIREEEDELYPAMKASLDAATNKKLTLMMNKEGFKIA